jgi:DNA invertase Pin-like site-specific DNA recombinase
VIVRDPAHPLFGRAFRVIRSVHRGGNIPISYEVEHRDGASLLIPVAATEPQHTMQNRTKLSIEALHDLTLTVEQLDADRSERPVAHAAAGTAAARSSTRSLQFWRRRAMKSELVKPTHLARRAAVYIRQSTTHQVVSNQESLRLQYALRQRAKELGWREADIDVIDADLGLSGASTARRSGFKELVGRVGLNEIGLILSIDVTRLARNCTDWYPLLDICGLHGCLIADRDGVYDPGSPNGRLLLGLKGTISELELHTIRSRLTAGLLAKAERGELALTLPIGLVRDPSGVVVKDPNMEVQERLDLLFSTFRY